MAKLPTYEELGKKVAEKAFEYIYMGKTLREWIDILKQESKTGCWTDDKCSRCGKGIEDLISSREWYKNEEPNFCPFCGAKIIKEAEG